MSRESIISSVKSPLGFFALAILVLEAGLLGSLNFISVDLQKLALYIFAGLAILLIISVLLIHHRPENGIDVDSLGHSLGVEIFYAFDPYISNLSDNERLEAYQSLLVQMKAPSDTRNKRVREKIAEVISQRAGIST